MATIREHVTANLIWMGNAPWQAEYVISSAKIMANEKHPGIPQDWDLDIGILDQRNYDMLMITVGIAYWHNLIAQSI